MMRIFSVLFSLCYMLFLSCYSHAEYRVSGLEMHYSNHKSVSVIVNEDEKSQQLEANKAFLFKPLETKLTVLGSDFKTSFIPMSKVKSVHNLVDFELPDSFYQQTILYLHTADAGAINLCRVLILTQLSTLSLQQQTDLLKRAGLIYQVYPEHLSVNCSKSKS